MMTETLNWQRIQGILCRLNLVLVQVLCQIDHIERKMKTETNAKRPDSLYDQLTVRLFDTKSILMCRYL